MKKYLLFVSFLFVLTLLGACDNDENQADVTLLNTWVLVSYGNESKEVLKEVEGYYYILTFNPNNTYSGWAYMNEIGGEYKCRGNKIEISYPDITKVYYEGTDGLTGTELFEGVYGIEGGQGFVFHKDGTLDVVTTHDCKVNEDTVKFAEIQYDWVAKDGKIVFSSNGTVGVTLIPTE